MFLSKIIKYIIESIFLHKAKKGLLQNLVISHLISDWLPSCFITLNYKECGISLMLFASLYYHNTLSPTYPGNFLNI